MTHNNRSKVSVIIPLYNQKEFIPKAIDSVLLQTHKNIEIIVVNDGSTDNPETELKQFKHEIILINQANKGLSGARNTGILNASGEYIQLLDADDFLHQDKIRLQLDFIKDAGDRISYCEVVQFDDSTGQISLRFIGELKDVFPSLYNTWFPYPLPIHSLLFRKDVFSEYGLFPEKLKAAEDRFFLSVLSLKGVKFHYYPFIGGYRRRHLHNMNINRLHIYNNMIQYYHMINEINLAKQYIKKKFGYTHHEMMRANLSNMYFKDIAYGLPRNMLKQIRKLFQKEKLRFFFDPIPCGAIPNKLLPLSANLSRWRSFLLKLIH